ncbi:hypothetical protein [Rhizobium sp. SL86]|uniref:hypothetical protein n=1 Tax=Rhizobium sp. SL86 TaxID=2995148 RepID=UPI0022746DF1|nr:hypothetical protein [Rhizobium sp. SL86]MCY1668605.1 hypothetical protein [Rhizobium sp. SL86]
MTDEAVSRLRLGDDTARFERAWKYEIIAPALAHPFRSPERKAEIDKLDGEWRLDWSGSRRKLTKSTLYKWIEIYENEGIHALAQKVRRDKGQKRVFINQYWSNAVPFDDFAKETIAEDIVQFIRGLIVKGTTRKIIRFMASAELRRLTAAYGYPVDDDAQAEKLFGIPDALITQEARFKAVYRHDFDRKASEDNKPRIRRTIAGLQPMEIVVMDVHHINVMVRRENGTCATPKFLAFHDVATNRVFGDLVFLNERGGVRNVDVIDAFKRMCQHPAFGMPQKLYCDNGSEYGFADYLEDALKLNCSVTAFNSEDRARVIRAKPYNASAKVVEGFFRQMNQQYFRHIPGWIDDNRMNPKRRELGKPMPPFEDGFDAFCETVFGLLSAYERLPQGGALGGKSPEQAFAAHVKDGWAATLIDEAQFYMAFTKPEKRKLNKHVFSLGGREWTCEELDRCFENTVIVRVPAYHGFNELLVETLQGERIGWAKPNVQLPYDDPRGAQTSAARDKNRKRALREMKRSVPDIDPLEKLIDIGKSTPDVVPNPPAALISVDVDWNRERAIVPTKTAKKTRQQREEEQQRLREARMLMINTAISGKGL